MRQTRKNLSWLQTLLNNLSGLTSIIHAGHVFALVTELGNTAGMGNNATTGQPNNQHIQESLTFDCCDGLASTNI